VNYTRLLNVGCRTVHLVAFALLLGGEAWGVAVERLLPVFELTVGSGAALLLLEVMADARWLVEARGAVVLLKLGLLLALPFVPEHRLALLVAVVVVASVGSHMPRWFRHASVVRLAAAARRVVRAG
jgi:hypothetical protein